MKVLYSLLVCLSFYGCSPSDPNPTTIDGTYQAKAYHTDSQVVAYPISGQSITLQLKSISTDSILVTLSSIKPASSLPINVYSPPAFTTIKAFMKTVPRQGYSNYYIYLTSVSTVNPALLQNAIVLASNSKLAFYNFPATSEQNHTIDFNKN